MGVIDQRDAITRTESLPPQVPKDRPETDEEVSSAPCPIAETENRAVTEDQANCLLGGCGLIVSV
jgi:hypothetical protein